MNESVKNVKNRLSLRKPQAESLEVFHDICELLSLEKHPVTLEDLRKEFVEELSVLTSEKERAVFITNKMSELASEFYSDDLSKVKARCPSLTSFERDFPSVCFALATGIGKTRLMGAIIAYLKYEYNYSNFFVIAPNLTIYNKLKEDFGTTSNPKYVFAGLDKFVNAPQIVDGENYEDFRLMSDQTAFNENANVTINIFNISKFNAETKTEKGKAAKIKRLNEFLGESYFDYLKSLPDLCVLMDESHHYHAEKSFDVINELKPILGVEVTATPQVQKGKNVLPFKNIVYEYSLSHALADEQFVKIPVAVNREDFKSGQYTPDELDRETLNDGIRLHIETQSELDIYARTNNKKIVKPFVLVVAKDTEHSKKIKEYLTSDDFYRGKYKNKVLEINSAQKGAEKDANIEQLLKVEDSNSTVEIVIHVNMLKEGWDVTNLYTIIPLRTSASDTLTVQTLGRGLRLPYGERTGVETVDRLYIVNHERYDDIVRLAKEEGSLIQKVYSINELVDSQGREKETVELTSAYEADLTSSTYLDKLALILPDIGTDSQEPEQVKKVKLEVAATVAQVTAEVTQQVNKQVKNINDVKDAKTKDFIEQTVLSKTKELLPDLKLEKKDIAECIKHATIFTIQTLTEKTIPIPVAVVQAAGEITIRYDKFTLDTSGIHYQPTEDTLIGTELRKGGKSYDIDVAHTEVTPTDTPINAIVKYISVKDNIDYSKASVVIYDVIAQLQKHLESYLLVEDIDKVLRQRRKNIAENLYQQIIKNFHKEGTSYTVSDMRPFSKIETGFASKFSADKIYKYTDPVDASEIRTKVFTGFEKSCHQMYKFESIPEKIFSLVLERDNVVLRWLRPSKKQFTMYYYEDHLYQPDFIVETEEKIYMVEVKRNDQLKHPEVLAKAKVGTEYCESATTYNLKNGGKAWEYKLISDAEVGTNSSFHGLMNTNVYRQENLDV